MFFQCMLYFYLNLTLDMLVEKMCMPETFHLLSGFKLSSLACITYCVKSIQIWSFFWSVFSRIRTEYRDMTDKSPYPVRTQKNVDQKKLQIQIVFAQCLSSVSQITISNSPVLYEIAALKILTTTSSATYFYFLIQLNLLIPDEKMLMSAEFKECVT